MCQNSGKFKHEDALQFLEALEEKNPNAKILSVLTDLTCTTTANICLRGFFLKTASIISHLQINITATKNRENPHKHPCALTVCLVLEGLKYLGAVRVFEYENQLRVLRCARGG